jgi:hypothetical protein
MPATFQGSSARISNHDDQRPAIEGKGLQI